MPRNNFWNRKEEIKVPSGLRAIVVRLYENVIANFRSIEGWSEEINYNIGVNQRCPLFPTLFCIYIDKLEACLEVAGCVGPTLSSIVIILFFYADDIVLMERNPYDLNKHLGILKDLCSSTRMIVDTDKTKVMIINSNKITYDTFVYGNNALEEVPSYKYLKFIFLTSSLGTIALRKV
jgi:hypothetical protein